MRPCSPGAYGRFSSARSAFGVSAMPSARLRRTLLREREVLDTIAFRAKFGARERAEMKLLSAKAVPRRQT
ncbi:hypothetical protein ACFPRL_01355 [Pseudoclavibacter helvolus]